MGLINVDILEYVTWGGTIDASDMKNFIIKDLHIFLTSDLTIKGSVVFINCLVCLNNNNIYSDDTLIMKNCVISGGRISFDEENCKGLYAPEGYIQDCSVNGFIPNAEICVKEIEHSDFFRCNRIVCGSEDITGDLEWDMILRGYNMAEFSPWGCLAILTPIILISVMFSKLGYTVKMLSDMVLACFGTVSLYNANNATRLWVDGQATGYVQTYGIHVVYGILLVCSCICFYFYCNKKRDSETCCEY